MLPVDIFARIHGFARSIGFYEPIEVAAMVQKLIKPVIKDLSCVLET